MQGHRKDTSCLLQRHAQRPIVCIRFYIETRGICFAYPAIHTGRFYSLRTETHYTQTELHPDTFCVWMRDGEHEDTHTLHSDTAESHQFLHNNEGYGVGEGNRMVLQLAKTECGRTLHNNKRRRRG